VVNNKGTADWSITKGHTVVNNKGALNETTTKGLPEWSITKGHTVVNAPLLLTDQSK
jgi:hypothetical protein